MHETELTSNIAFLAAAGLTGCGNRAAFSMLEYVRVSSYKC